VGGSELALARPGLYPCLWSGRIRDQQQLPLDFLNDSFTSSSKLIGNEKRALKALFYKVCREHEGDDSSRKKKMTAFGTSIPKASN
jgi:hypothetical protein